MTVFPNDADGNALRRVAGDGSDMSAPMVIDFAVVFPAERPARRFATAVAQHGFDVDVAQHDDNDEWDVICSRNMVATHADVVRVQNELGKLAQPLGGYCDGWGTFGNKPDHDSTQ